MDLIIVLRFKSYGENHVGPSREIFSCGSSEPRNSSSCGFKKRGNCHFFYAWCCHKALISTGRNFKLKVRPIQAGGLI